MADEWNRGSGVWGRELDEGMLILVGDIEIGELCTGIVRTLFNLITLAIR